MYSSKKKKKVCDFLQNTRFSLTTTNSSLFNFACDTFYILFALSFYFTIILFFYKYQLCFLFLNKKVNIVYRISCEET